MDSNKKIILYRKKVANLILVLRKAVFAESDFKIFPTDKALAERIGITNVAFSSLVNCTTSASGPVLHSIISLLYVLLTKEEFDNVLSEFAIVYNG